MIKPSNNSIFSVLEIMESKMKNNRAFAKLFAIVLIIKYMQIFVLADDDGETATTEFG